MRRRARMVVDVNTRRLVHRTIALGAAWGGLLILSTGGTMADVRRMVDALEGEGR
jgi:hypothetical protein